MSKSIKEIWEDLSPNMRRGVTATAVVLAVFGVLYYAASGKIEEKKKYLASKLEPPKEETSKLFDGDTLERDLYDRLQAELQQKSEELERARKQQQQALEKMERLVSEFQNTVRTASNSKGAVAPDISNEAVNLDMENARIEIPPPPPPPPAATIRTTDIANGEAVFATPVGNNNQTTEVDEVIGGIGRVTPEIIEVDQEVKKNSVHLSPSFMEAMLLTGMDATIGGEAMSHPKPALLRVAAPAVLPNSVKANLTGCFVFASGYGTLADQRINLRLTNMSCLDRDGKAVIEEKISGYVVDADGKIGVRARVYMEAGKIINRMAVLGALQGIAGVLNSNASVTQISPLGTTTTIDTDKMEQAAVGSAAIGATDQLAKFYKILVEQTLPTVETGPKKKLTVVIDKPVDLEIRYYCNECEI